MTRCRRLLPALCVLAMGVASAVPLAAQQPPSPAQTNPLPTTTAPNPPADPNRSAAPAPDQALVPPPAGRPRSRSIPRARRSWPSPPSRVMWTSDPAGETRRDSLRKGEVGRAVQGLQKAFAQIEADLAKAGIKPAGRPLAVFTKTEDAGFEFDAMIPIAAAPGTPPTSEDGLHFGTTPSGKALRFAHRGSYEAIDSTYETLTAYLDAKDIVVQDRFMEEYVTDLKDGTDDSLDVNIYALLK